jgi:hypothetical protein
MAVIWEPLSDSPGQQGVSGMWLMQDGSILANLYSDTQLMALHPDEKGSYANGSWSSVGNFLLEKLFYASAVLPDGRLVACGGEYYGRGLPNTPNNTNFCEIYDYWSEPQASTQITPPNNWSQIGDTPSVVLNDGTYMMDNIFGNQVALLNSSTLTWTFGDGDQLNEQGWVLLQTGDVLTTSLADETTQRYDPTGNKFVPDAPMPVTLGSKSNEIGPGIALMDGRVIWFGATGHTCIYTPTSEGENGSWVQGPDLPIMPNGDQLITADVGAILEPNGKVFVLTSGKNTLSAFVEYDPVHNTCTVVYDTPTIIGALNIGALNVCRMLLLPNGHGLIAFSNGACYDLTFDSGGDASWAPAITSFPPTVVLNTTVTLAGVQLCGLSECQSFGDDNQQAENYPMVRFVDSANNVTYARAHDVSTRSIAPGEHSTVLVDIPNMAPGLYSLEVVAMGIPSRGSTVEVLAQAPEPLVSEFSLVPNDVICGQSATGVVTLDPPSLDGPVEVIVVSSGPNAGLVQFESPIKFIQNQSQSKPFSIRTTDLATPFNKKPVTLTASADDHGLAKSVTLNIVTPTVADLEFQPTDTVPLGGTCTAVVTLDRVAKFAIQVNMTWSGGWWTPTPQTVTIPAGAIASDPSDFMISAPATLDAFGSVQNLLYAMYEGTSVSATLTLEPAPGTGVLASLFVPGYDVVGGSTVFGSVTLESVVSNDTTVALRADPTVRTQPGTDIPLPRANVPSSVIIPGGQLSADFPIKTDPLPPTGADHTVSITANAFATKSEILTLRVE